MAEIQHTETTPLTPFHFDAHEVRIHLAADDTPWWLLTDVCQVLGLTNPSKAAERLKPNESTTLTFGYTPLLVINEKGLYRLIMRSNKPDAERFQEWVFGEVLPQIRKTGRYESVQTLTDPLAHYPELRAIRELIVATAEARDEAAAARLDAQEAKAIAARAEDKSDMALDETRRMTLEEFILINGLLRQFPLTRLGTYTAWLKDWCAQYAQRIDKAPVLGKSWDNENAYPIQALAAWLRYEQKRPRQITLVSREEQA